MAVPRLLRSAEEMEQELARIRRLAERYALLKLASKILQQEIERYREEHQDPVLKIASGYFSDLTMGSFAGLRTDVDDKGEPILVGVRPDNLRLTVEKMSSGTRDQLFLALRLATLEWRLETSEPMPFIVDDILINFDDDRSKATLKVLADLSKKNQVILFTHHRQIVEEARQYERKGGNSNPRAMNEEFRALNWAAIVQKSCHFSSEGWILKRNWIGDIHTVIGVPEMIVGYFPMPKQTPS